MLILVYKSRFPSQSCCYDQRPKLTLSMLMIIKARLDTWVSLMTDMNIVHWTWVSIPSELETLQSALLSQDDLKIETIDICYRQATNTTLRVVHFWLQLPQELTLSLSMSTKARLGKIGYMSILLWQQWILFCFDHFASRLYVCKLHLLLDLLFWEYPISPRLDTEGTYWDHDWPFVPLHPDLIRKEHFETMIDHLTCIICNWILQDTCATVIVLQGPTRLSFSMTIWKLMRLQENNHMTDDPAFQR